MTKTVLVTGSSGLVGSSLVELLEKKKWKVVGIDNNARSRNLGTPRKEKGLNVDFTMMADVSNLFQNNKFDAVVHAGGQASHDWSNDHVVEDFITNALGTVILLEATRKYCPEATFVYVSTDKVYGENMSAKKFEMLYTDVQGNLSEKPMELVETPTRFTFNSPGFSEGLGLDFAGHRSPFGCSKTAADIYVQEYANTFGLITGVFRPGCITGKNHEGAELHGMFAYLAKTIREGKTYKIFGFKGKQVRDQIHANDLAEAIYTFVRAPIPGEVFNIGGGPERSISILEAGEMIAKKVGKPFKYEYGPERPGDRVWDVHDVSKFRVAYPDWDYKYSLDDIINDVVSKEL